MNTKPLTGMRLGVLLFPQVDNTVSGVLLEKLNPEEAQANLRAGAFNYNAEIESFRLFADTPVTTLSIDQRLTEIAVNIPAYLCRLGSRAFEDVDTLGGCPRTHQNDSLL